MESLIGKTIDNYRILEVIGRGGMGVVFKAQDTNLDKIVALKMIDPFLASDENFIRRFKTEAKALAKLENPNIVVVHALRETEAGFFMVMEYVEPRPLSKYISENGPLNVKEAIAITKQLLNAIGHAHKFGIIHRDIKPSNILLGFDGKIKVTDFGLAKVVQQKGHESTITQARAGTLYYMSPEQVKGLKNVDIRSDLYSLGMTVYEMIAGRVPFEKTESDYTIQKKIVEGEIPSPIRFNSNIPQKFTKIISKSIDKDPDKRYQNSQEMLDDLVKFEKEIFDKKEEVKSSSNIKPLVKPDLRSYFKKEKILKLFPDFKFIKNPIFIISLFSVIIITVVLYFILSPGNPYLSIETTPSEANIKINDAAVGKSPMEHTLDKEGIVYVSINKEGYTSIDTSLNLVSGQKENLLIELQPIPKEKISIVTEPAGAGIIINDRFAGNSPLLNYALNNGEHQIRIEKEGYITIDTTIRIVAGLNPSVEFKMIEDDIKDVGTLIITTVPIGAFVFLDGRKKEKTPYENKELPAKTYKLKIRKEGFKDIVETIKIVKDSPLSINRILTRACKLTVNTNPIGAEVFIDNKPSGNTPFIDDQMMFGKYTITIKKEGFKNYSEYIILSNNEPTKNIDKKLEQIFSKISITIKPYGDIYIDGKLYMKSVSLEQVPLGFGKHTIEVKHKTFGMRSIDIDIKDESPKSIKFNLKNKE